jgi:hypothetical protein
MIRSVTSMFMIAAAVVAVAQPTAGWLRPQGRSEPSPSGSMNTLTADERAQGWRLLFDGRSLTGWRGFRQQSLPAGWRVVDGTMTCTGKGGDIITVEQFEDFELMVDWNLAPGGNSGIFYRVTEDAELMWHTAPEFQLLDEAAHPGIRPEATTGSNYALHAPAHDVAHPPGSWNRARVLVRGSHVEHWLNGVQLVAYELGSPEWERLVLASKFKDQPRYGRARIGHIGLQDHGDRVAFRNLKIRQLR